MLWVCVSVFLPELSGMQIPPFLRSIILSSMAFLALTFSSTLPLEWHNFCKKKYLYIICVFWFFSTNLPEIFFILQKKSATYYHKFICLPVKQSFPTCAPRSPKGSACTSQGLRGRSKKNKINKNWMKLKNKKQKVESK